MSKDFLTYIEFIFVYGFRKCSNFILLHLAVQFSQNHLLKRLSSIIYWDCHIFFIFQFVNMVYHIGWFANIDESLHSWNKSNLIMVYELFDVVEFCLLKFCWGFLHLCSSMILTCSFHFLFCLCLDLVSGGWWPHRMSLEVFLPWQFFERVIEG